ncbi:hypothetical protein [Pantoea agglomerans]|uniref:hypothetical protein n=1 Tax=Enterobacter agglomerans TaxID=549 RepID=UPI003C7D457D
MFVQINTAHEPSKYGLHPDDAEVFLQQLASFSSLWVKGLMTLAGFTQDAAHVRASSVCVRYGIGFVTVRLRVFSPHSFLWACPAILR